MVYLWIARAKPDFALRSLFTTIWYGEYAVTSQLGEEESSLSKKHSIMATCSTSHDPWALLKAIIPSPLKSKNKTPGGKIKANLQMISEMFLSAPSQSRRPRKASYPFPSLIYPSSLIT